MYTKCEVMALRDLSYEHLMELIVRALNKMDERLAGHGERVAYRVMLLAQRDGRFPDKEICKLIWTVLLHDIGNYQHLDIVDLMERETLKADSHALYGYLFLKYFGPYPAYAPIIYYHHSDRQRIEASAMNDSLKWISHSILAADAVDLYRISHPNATQEDVLRFLSHLSTERYHPRSVQALKEIEAHLPHAQEEIHNALIKQLSRWEISVQERQAFLKVLVSSIDFRSRATTLHCAIIVEVSDMLAQLCDVTEQEKREIHIGAILHDLGKIAIPVEILEHPGKLEGEDWEIMKSHIIYSEEIIDGMVSDSIKNIAIRHHEKLDGTGYPRGLRADSLTLPERILAVADVVSALSEERSYKPVFPMEEVVRIIEGMSERGKLCPKVVSILTANKERIYEKARQIGQRTREDYEHIFQEFSLDRKTV